MRISIQSSVVTKDDLQAIVIERNLGSKSPSVSDLVGFNNLSKEIGTFTDRRAQRGAQGRLQLRGNAEGD